MDFDDSIQGIPGQSSQNDRPLTIIEDYQSVMPDIVELLPTQGKVKERKQGQNLKKSEEPKSGPTNERRLISWNLQKMKF